MQRIRYSITGFLIATALVTPFALSAQSIYSPEIQARIDAYMARIAELTARLQALRAQATSTLPVLPSLGRRHRICLIVRTLGEGESNDEVRALQEFLLQEGLLNSNATGFFGPLTRDALRRWQANNGVVSEGSAATTGWGVFGPRTRSFIARWCGGAQPIIPGILPQDTFRPIGATSTTPGNLPPSIVNFSGPTSLIVGATGTWTATATDPEGGTLTYHINWGDTNSAVNVLLQLADLDTAVFTASTTFTHSYSRAGYYAVTVRVRDGSGGTAGATRLVRVDIHSADENPGGFGLCLADARQCTNGHWVGRTGPNCQFVCPAGTSVMDDDADEDTDDANPPQNWGGCGLHQIVSDSGRCVYREGAGDGSCWWNNLYVANGSWVQAYEQQFVASGCKMQIRTCQNGSFTGTYKYPSCTASTEGNGA